MHDEPMNVYIVYKKIIKNMITKRHFARKLKTQAVNIWGSSVAIDQPMPVLEKKLKFPASGVSCRSGAINGQCFGSNPTDLRGNFL